MITNTLIERDVKDDLPDRNQPFAASDNVVVTQTTASLSG
jgi:hypothetical protein